MKKLFCSSKGSCSPCHKICGVILLVVLVAGGFLGAKHIQQKAFQNGVIAGQKSAIIEVINRTIEGCQAINLFAGDKTVDLANIQCDKEEVMKNIEAARKASTSAEAAAAKTEETPTEEKTEAPAE